MVTWHGNSGACVSFGDLIPMDPTVGKLKSVRVSYQNLEAQRRH